MRKLLKYFFNRETITYFFCGCLTILVNYSLFWILLRRLGDEYALFSNAVAFIVSTCFAFLTNKVFVFQSKSFLPKTFFKEMFMFFCARLFSFFFVEQLGLLICRDYFHVGDYSFLKIDGIFIAKVFLSGIAVIVNYVCSKFIIFRKKKRNTDESVTDHSGL